MLCRARLHNISLLLLRAKPTPTGGSGHCPSPKPSDPRSRDQRVPRHHIPPAKLEFNDALYKGRAPIATKKSLTILLPKERQPVDWGQTRPLTLSSSMLKWQAQLLLVGRIGEAVMKDARHQFARQRRQAPELTLLLRRAAESGNPPSTYCKGGRVQNF